MQAVSKSLVSGQISGLAQIRPGECDIGHKILLGLQIQHKHNALTFVTQSPAVDWWAWRWPRIDTLTWQSGHGR
ncbi:hypothetical protein KIN_37250 [Litoreibacter roseus]|uniref:Uncharacterized protein n=1 Tax=Litoreibacter roseus TaxID=2601869 RepID=A0A6N6JK06_9RHOB|nr:hypothetical protein KIN_37250 [Litoreibacter roseus]